MLGHHLSLLVFMCLQIKTMVAEYDPVKCDPVKADLHFLLDISKSRNDELVNKQVEFVKEFIRKSYIDPQHKLIGLSFYAQKDYPGFNMGDFKDRYQLDAAIDKAKLAGKDEYNLLEKGLERREGDFFPVRGGRPGVKNILIVITNGDSGTRGKTDATKIKKDGITIQAVLLKPASNKQAFIDSIPSDRSTDTVEETDLSKLGDAVKELLVKQCTKSEVTTEVDIKAVKEALKKTDDNNAALEAALKKIGITFRKKKTENLNIIKLKLNAAQSLEDIVEAHREVLVDNVDEAVKKGDAQTTGPMVEALEEMGYDLFRYVSKDLPARKTTMRTYLKQRQIPKLDGKDIDQAYRKVMVKTVAYGANEKNDRLLALSLRALGYNIFNDINNVRYCTNCGEMGTKLKERHDNVGANGFNEKVIDQVFLDNVKAEKNDKTKLQAALELIGIYSYEIEKVLGDLKNVVEFNRDNLKAALIRDRVDRVNKEITDYENPNIKEDAKYRLSDALKLLDIEVLYIEEMYKTLKDIKAKKPHNEPLTLADLKEAYQAAIIHEVNVAVDEKDAVALAAALKKLDDELNLDITPIEDINGILKALEDRKHEKRDELDLKDIMAILKPPTTEPPVDTTVLIIAIVAAFAVVALVIGAVIYCVLKRRREAVEREAALEAAAEEEEEARLEQEAAEEEERRAKEEAEKKAGWGLGAVFGSSATVNTQPSGVPSGSSRRKSSLKTAQDTASPESSSDAAPAKSYISAGRKSSKKSNLSAARRKSSVARKGSQI